jgi:hypothetical protein
MTTPSLFIHFGGPHGVPGTRAFARAGVEAHGTRDDRVLKTSQYHESTLRQEKVTASPRRFPRGGASRRPSLRIRERGGTEFGRIPPPPANGMSLFG